MTEESSPLSGGPSSVSKKVTPAVKRISNPRPKKVAKEKEPVAPVSPPEAVKEPRNEEFRTEWPEPEVASSGGNSSQTDPAKRKRRRRKGKGSAANMAAGNTPESPEFPQEIPTSEAPAEQPKRVPVQPHSQSLPPRPRVDSEQLTKMAWKIFLAEVSEEGVALISDQDAKELSRRCFRLAEIFIEEHLRRR